MGKLRKCRSCKKSYTVPSQWPGCCSEKCKRNRTLFLTNIDTKPRRIALKEPSNLQRWYKLRYEALILYGRKCLCCGSKDQLQVDHIKSVHKFPELQWDINNLQILCMPCNKGKGSRYINDFRI